MNWKQLTSLNQIHSIIDESSLNSVSGILIFKHSTRCSISLFAKKNLESSWSDDANFPTYYLDLLEHRDVSDKLSETFEVQHQSPQVLLIKGGECIYNASHDRISSEAILQAV
jgi:bacillithiol system protein YtxJ